MISILVIEDDTDKRRAICTTLGQTESGGRMIDVNIVEVATSVEARNALAADRYDLVVLDIALPRRSGSDVDLAAGLDILNELIERPQHYRTPTHIIGLTSYEELLASVRPRFAAHLLTLTLYQPSSTDWSEALQARLRHISHAMASAEHESGEAASDLAVLCALQIELNAVLALPWDWQQVSLPRDHTIYWKGQFLNAHGTRSVYAAACPRMGMPASAAVAAKMIHAMRPRFMCMTGIAAGVRGRVDLGDVIVADPCWDYGSGKWSVAEHIGRRFSAAPYQIALDPWVRERVALAARDGEWLRRAVSNWNGPAASPSKLVLGPLASGAAVLADGVSAKSVVDQNRQVLGIEMEAYGVFAAAEEAMSPRPRVLVLKAAVDFADGKKDDSYQGFGAYISAAAMKRFAEEFI